MDSPESTQAGVIDLDKYRDTVPDLETSGPVLTLTSSADNWDRIRSVLCSLRASNASGLLLLKKPEDVLEDEEIVVILDFLREWDQLLLHNVLGLCANCIPAIFMPHLELEAKNELKWFREWLTALCDPRIYRYPGLPWRSFVRKISAENHAFGLKLLDLVSRPASSDNIQAVQNLFSEFLENKRKVICVFPTNWGRTQ